MDPGATLRIKLAENTDSNAIVVDRETVSFWSSCAKGRPETAAEWDLSQLIIEGKPVKRSILVAWLNAIFSMVYGKQFEPRGPFTTDPCADAAGLAQLLAFADAAGSPRGLIVAFLSQLKALKFRVTWGDGVVPIAAVGRTYWRKDNSTILRTSWDDQSIAVPSLGAKNAVIQQAAAATESLLYLAYKLQLPELQKAIGTWVRLNSAHSNDLLSGVLDSVVSSRVLAAAASGEQLFRQLVLTSLTKP